MKRGSKITCQIKDGESHYRHVREGDDISCRPPFFKNDTKRKIKRKNTNKNDKNEK